MQEETCPVCGELNAPDAAFCRSCGSYLGWDVAPVRPQSKEPRRPSVTAPPDAPDVPDAAFGALRGDTTPVGGPDDGAARTPPADRPAGPATARSVATSPDPPAAAAAPAARQGPTAAVDGDREPASAPAPVADPATATVRAGLCPECGTENDLRRRFCRRCGHALLESAAAPPLPVAAPPRRRRRQGLWPGWRTSGAPAEARRAFRRALPMRYRVGRVAAVAVPLTLVGGVFAATGSDPVGGARRLWADLNDRTVPVADVRASADPDVAVSPEWEPGDAVDGAAGNAWGTIWNPAAPMAEACTTGAGAGAAAALVLQWDDPAEVRGLRVVAGVPADDPDAARIARPRELELRFDSTCVAVTLEDTDAETSVDVRGVVANQVRVAVTSVHPPGDAGWPDVDPVTPDVAISEITLLQRPR